MIATDSLSLVFIACIVFPGTFLTVMMLLGLGHGHGLHGVGGHGHHLGGHAAAGGHQGHVGSGSHHAAAAPAHSPPSSHAPPPGTRVSIGAQHGHVAHQAGMDGGHSPFAALHLLETAFSPNPNAIMLFLIGFGAIGYYLHNIAHALAIVAFTLAALFGIIVGGTLNVVLARLINGEAGRLGRDSSDMVGRIATVSIAIRAAGMGEIIFPGDNGARRSLGARAENGGTIPRDAEVVITAYLNGIATVETWEAFLAAAARTTSDVAQTTS